MVHLFLSKEHFETQLSYARRKFELLERFSHFIAIYVKISAKSAKYPKTRYLYALKSSTSPIYFFQRYILKVKLAQ